MNPTYKELIAIEEYRNNNTERIYNNKHRNNWIKAIISIFAIAMLLSIMGVPIYNGIVALEENAMPYQLGNSLEAPTATGGYMGDIIAYELWHWGAMPSPTTVSGFIVDGLKSAGLGYLTMYVGFLVTEVLVYIASGGLTTLTVTDALENALFVLGIGAGTGGTALVVVAGIIVAA